MNALNDLQTREARLKALEAIERQVWADVRLVILIVVIFMLGVAVGFNAGVNRAKQAATSEKQ